MTYTRVVLRARPSPPTEKRGHLPRTLAQQKQALRCLSDQAFLQRCTRCGDFNDRKKVQGPEQLEDQQPKPQSRPSPGRSDRPRTLKWVISIQRQLTIRTVKMFQSQIGTIGKERDGKFGSFYQLITLMPSQKPSYDQTRQNCHL